MILAGNITSTTNLVITSSLTFTRVRTSQAGTYTCVVNMTIPGVAVDHQFNINICSSSFCHSVCQQALLEGRNQPGSESGIKQQYFTK